MAVFAPEASRSCRLFLEAVLWRLRTDAPWQDRPPHFGKCMTPRMRFRRWAGKGMSERTFTEHSQNPGFEWAPTDGTIVQVHRHGSSAKGGLKVMPSANRATGQPPGSSPRPMRPTIWPGYPAGRPTPRQHRRRAARRRSRLRRPDHDQSLRQ